LCFPHCQAKAIFLTERYSQNSDFNFITLLHGIDAIFQEPIENDDDDDDELEIDDPELESLVCYPFKGGKSAVKHYHIFCLVLMRVDDVAPLIRTKSLNILAEMLATQHDNGPLKHVISASSISFEIKINMFGF